MIKVLFVCLGNICRSPLAEGIFAKQIEENKVQHMISCDSAGTASYHIGELPDPRTRKNASLHGLNLRHRARAFDKEDFSEFDYIIAMDEQNLKTIYKLNTKKSKVEILLMRMFDTIDKGSAVPDPYLGNEKDFEEVYQILSRCCNNLITFVNQNKLHHEAL